MTVISNIQNYTLTKMNKKERRGSVIKKKNTNLSNGYNNIIVYFLVMYIIT